MGLMGLLNAAKNVKIEKMKSLDAWVFMNVRGDMRNMRRFRQNDSLDLFRDAPPGAYVDARDDEDNLIRHIDLKIALERGSIEAARAYLEGYEPMRDDPQRSIERYHRGEIGITALSRELGISKRQTYKLLGTLPASW